ncbi:MAG: hypothetical protein ACYC9Y_04120 [Candidatus Methylomirabilia bacterium]
MSRINPEGQITRRERLVTVIAVLGAVVVHVVAIFGWGRIYQWTQEEQKKERLMVIRRVRDITPPRETIPAPAREVNAPPEGRAGGGAKSPPPPPPPDPKVKERGPDPPKQTELSPAMEQELEEKTAEKKQAAEYGDNSVSVVTDLPAASFIVRGPAEYRGSGTFWIRKGAAPGRYTVTFNPVAGFTTPPVQTKDLAAKGQIVFFGKYRRSTELVVDSNHPGAEFTIYRPDGRPLDIKRPGRALLDDLPPGTYTVVFKDLPGLVTPAALSRTLGQGGKLSFYGEYGKGTAGSGAGGGRGSGGTGSGEGDGRGSGGAGSGRGGKSLAKLAAVSHEGALDRRVQMIVKSYPPSRVEEDFLSIPYPEVIIRKSNFQQGWCQVYLVLTVNDRAEVESVIVERPEAADRTRFGPLIKAVESAVRSWDYDTVRAEVHVDVRFYVE